MANVTAHDSSHASDLADLVCENLDTLTTYANHLTGDPRRSAEWTMSGIAHAARFPPASLSLHGRAALYRSVTRSCRQGQRGGRGRALLWRRTGEWQPQLQGVEEASRINTVKRAMATLSFDRRAALLLRNLAGLSYRELGVALECSPEAAARLVAAGRREFGLIYREIAL